MALKDGLELIKEAYGVAGMEILLPRIARMIVVNAQVETKITA